MLSVTLREEILKKHKVHAFGSPPVAIKQKQLAKPRMSLFENGFKLCFDIVELKISSRASGIRANFFLKRFLRRAVAHRS